MEPRWLLSSKGGQHDDNDVSLLPSAVTRVLFPIRLFFKWMVVHFYRPTTERCQIVDAHLERLAPKHLETRVRGNGIWIGSMLIGVNRRCILLAWFFRKLTPRYTGPGRDRGVLQRRIRPLSICHSESTNASTWYVTR